MRFSGSVPQSGLRVDRRNSSWPGLLNVRVRLNEKLCYRNQWLKTDPDSQGGAAVCAVRLGAAHMEAFGILALRSRVPTPITYNPTFSH